MKLARSFPYLHFNSGFGKFSTCPSPSTDNSLLPMKSLPQALVPRETHEMGKLGALLVFCAIYLILRNRKPNCHTKGYDVVANLPGPKPLPIVGNAHELWNKDERSSVLHRWFKEFRTCFAIRFGPETIVMLNSVEHIQTLLSSSDHLSKPWIYDLFRPFWRDGVILSSPEKWRHRRRIISRAFTHRTLSGYMHSFNKHSEQLVSHLGEIFQTNPKDSSEKEGKPINTLLWRLSFRIICETTLGVDANEISSDLDILLNTLEECKSITMNRILKPWLINELLWSFHPDKKTLKKGCEAMGEFAQKVVDHHRSVSRGTERTPGPDGEHNLVPGMKKQFVSLLDEGIAAGLDDEGLLEEIMSMIIAGYETSSTTIQFVLMVLATHQEDQNKCRQEVDDIFENASLSPGGKLTLEGTANMKYLHKCVEETMRLYPAVFFYFRKLDTLLKLEENLELPEGTTVGIFVQGIHRNPEYFPNPDEFIPDRFSEENSKGRRPYTFLPFSMGPRNCLGFKYGLVEVKTTVAWILRHFVVTTTDKFEDVKIHLDLALTPERGYNFRLKKRQH